MRLPRLFLAMAILSAGHSAAYATITSVAETNLGADAAAIIVNGGFNEDVLALADRNHEHNGARFSDALNGLFVSGLAPVASGLAAQFNLTENTVVNVPLPAYMVGGDYVRFANDARDNVGYTATITASAPSKWYLLIDNRWNGQTGGQDNTSWDDPVLGGNLQWVIDDGWQRVNTGISPNNLADFTALDEYQNSNPNTLGVGPGILVDNFYAVYSLPTQPTQITTGSIAMSGATMYSVVSVAVPEPSSLVIMVCGMLCLATTRRCCR